MYFPQSLQDEELLKEFHVIQNKYNLKLLDGLIIYKSNSLYPRLACSNRRGIAAGREVVENLCNGLIDNVPISILSDIKNAKLSHDNKFNLITSNIPISILHLRQKPPDYILNEADYFIKRLLEKHTAYEVLIKILKLSTLTDAERKMLIIFA